MALEWTAELLRLSLFCSAPASLSSVDWKTITGEDEPETQQKLAGGRAMVGPFLDGNLALSAVGTRVDCILNPRLPSPALEDNHFPSVGGWPAVCDEFVMATANWVRSFAVPVVRLAFAPVLLGECPTRLDAYRSLASLLRTVTGDPEHLKELIFRINWPVNSALVNGLILNRITHWSVIELQVQRIMMVQQGAPAAMDTIPLGFAIRLEMDHNTEAGRIEPFDQSRLAPIYRELVTLALENAEKGELK
jgi:hypothetical protein